MNHATERLAEAADASLVAWDGEEESVREEHQEVIEELRNALDYFAAHGSKASPSEKAVAEILEILSAPRWDSSTPEAIAEALTRRGFTIA